MERPGGDGVGRRAGGQVSNDWQVGVPGFLGQNTTATLAAPQAPVTTSAVIAAARDAAQRLVADASQ